ncbi:hypothetical protein OO013_02735 [Mangrovivirga sp. M17]|uniref:Uncharacterized protein n=1 Tax=Mangrovivirga halotolerans TaxID=2993936 RepID=A0ABT3RLS4_9BACT|nr:hypothetical protein [Mangrovivirga halotolerans]MCX2742763.1 hypothetical protein [Mangrovivirga halotolerans]
MTEEHLPEHLFNLGQYNYKYAFATFPSVKLYRYSDSDEWRNHLLFGDMINIIDTEITNDRVRVRCRNNAGWVKVEDIQKNRVLEMNFIDGGEGDGCHIITPDNKNILVDAGNSANMNHYLFWRFDLYRKEKLQNAFSAVVTRNDRDYFGGFKHIFNNEELPFDNLYFNGFLAKKGNEDGFEFVADQHKLSDRIKTEGTSLIKIFRNALEHNKNLKFYPINNKTEFLNGYDSENTINDEKFNIQILSPLADNSMRLNQAIRLKITYGNAQILLGGESDKEDSQEFIDYYSDSDKSSCLKADVVSAGPLNKKLFDKSLIEAADSRVIIFSTGGDESNFNSVDDITESLGEKIKDLNIPVVTTDLAHAKAEFNKEKKKYIFDRLEKIKQVDDEIENEENKDKLKTLEAIKIKARKEIDSMITKYGMINLRTDGERLVIARELDEPEKDTKWKIYSLEYSDSSKRFEIVN